MNMPKIQEILDEFSDGEKRFIIDGAFLNTFFCKSRLTHFIFQTSEEYISQIVNGAGDDNEKYFIDEYYKEIAVIIKILKQKNGFKQEDALADVKLTPFAINIWNKYANPLRFKGSELYYLQGSDNSFDDPLCKMVNVEPFISQFLIGEFVRVQRDTFNLNQRIKRYRESTIFLLIIIGATLITIYIK